jgi:3'-5' exonuclease
MPRIYIDIETFAGPDKPEPESIPAPANYKDPAKIAAYQSEKVDEVWRKQALDSMAGQIICIGYAIAHGPVRTITVGQDAKNERHAMELLGADASCIRTLDTLEWVGHNFQGFDGVWLRRKAIKYGLVDLARSINLDRYRGNVRDTMLMWSPHDARDRVSLGNIAEYLCLGEKNGNGADVHDLWLAGRKREIAEYCRQDVELTRAVYKHLAKFEAI